MWPQRTLGHVLQDIGVLIASVLIWIFPQIPLMQLVDPLFTIVFSLFGLIPTVDILRVTFRILMQGTPKSLDVDALKQEMQTIQGVASCHELHV